jgi:hypothetical protein
VFSVNDQAGPRTAENGWAEALGIEDGNFTPQYGGGICQVSSTMYNAVLKAEMTIRERVPHSIKSTYVKDGLDATISTGSPDFKFENPYDTALYMIIKTSVPDNRITVEIWGTMERDYDVELFTEMISDEDEKIPQAEIRVNTSLGEYDVNELKPGRRYEKWQVYKRYVDKVTGEVMQDRIEVTTSTYPDITPVYEVGSGVPYTAEMTLAQLRAAAQQAAAEHDAQANITDLAGGATDGQASAEQGAAGQGGDAGGAGDTGNTGDTGNAGEGGTVVTAPEQAAA